MAQTVSKITVALAAASGLLLSGSALAAGTVEVAVSKGAATAVVSPAIVVTASSGETNLQKTPTAIFVMGIEAKTTPRKH